MSPRERSKRMSLIRSTDTKPEIRVRSILHRLGYRFRLHRKDLPGKPDIVFPARKKIIFVHGCFWHAHNNCKVANQPKTRQAYWEDKFRRNKERDKKNKEKLKKMGWGVYTIWECETKNEKLVIRKLSKFLGPATNRQGATGVRHG